MPTLRRVPVPREQAHEPVVENCESKMGSSEDERFSQSPLLHSAKKVKLNDTLASPLKFDSSTMRDEKKVDQFSIASALERHRNRLKNGTGKVTFGSIASDVVAVVLSAPIKQDPPQPCLNYCFKTTKPRSQRIHLLIGDHSLSDNGKCCRVSLNVSRNASTSMMAMLLGMHSLVGGVIPSPMNELKGPSSVQSTEELGMLQPGDIIRWNRLEVRDDFFDEKFYEKKIDRKSMDTPIETSEGKDGLSKNKKTLLDVVCDLCPSFIDPAIGPTLARLCRVVPSNSAKSTDEVGFHLLWEMNIPQSMETSIEIIKHLARWYCSNHYLKLSRLPPNHPCQKRRLRDISCPNMYSHVVVKVLRCEKALFPHNSSLAGHEELSITHATLADGPDSDDILGMTGSICNNVLSTAISSVLLQSISEGSYILITHLLSQSSRPSAMGHGASLEGRESLILVPTRSTTAVAITPDHPYFIKQQTCSRKQNDFASQPLTIEWASELFSMTQQHSQLFEIPMNDTQQMNRCRGMMAIVAPLIDIIVDGIDTSFIEGSHWQSPASLSKFLVDMPVISTGMASYKLCPSYRSATLVLDRKVVSEDIIVNADGDALKLLCMDVPVLDMVLDDNSNSRPHPYLPHVGSVLRALCKNQIPLRWVLEQESESNWFASSATILEI
ncbi:hypothetical protein ACHAXS_013109 [Conticribra weissflogii]